MASSMNWADGAAGGTPVSAANLNKLAVTADIGVAGTPTGDAGRAAYAPTARYYARDYSVPTDKTSNASTAIQAMLDAAKSAASADGTRRTVVLDKPTKYVLTSAISIDTTFVSFDGNGSTLDTSAIASGPGVNVTATVGSVETNSFGNNMCRLENFRLTGAGKTQNHGGLLFDSSTSGSVGPARIDVSRVVATRMGIGFDYGNNAYAIKLDQCESYFNSIGIRAQASTNSGERFTFVGCTIYDNDTNVQMLNSGGNMKFFGCSNDYPSNGGKMFDISAGRVTWTGGHIEGSHDLGYWFSLQHGTAQLGLRGVELVIAGNKVNYALGNIETGTGDPARDVKFAGVTMDDVYIKWGTTNTYSRGALFSGTGRVQASQLTFNDTAPQMPPVSRSLNCVEGSFETVTNLQLWSHRSGISQDLVNFYEGAASAKFSVGTAGTNANMDWECPVMPGQLVLTSFRYITSGLAAAGATFQWQISWFTATQGTTVAQIINVGQTTTISADASSWTLVQTPPLIVPPRAAYVKLLFQGVAWPLGVSVNVDDVIVNVI